MDNATYIFVLIWEQDLENKPTTEVASLTIY